MSNLLPVELQDFSPVVWNDETGEWDEIKMTLEEKRTALIELNRRIQGRKNEVLDEDVDMLDHEAGSALKSGKRVWATSEDFMSARDEYKNQQGRPPKRKKLNLLGQARVSFEKKIAMAAEREDIEECRRLLLKHATKREECKPDVVKTLRYNNPHLTALFMTQDSPLYDGHGLSEELIRCISMGWYEVYQLVLMGGTGLTYDGNRNLVYAAMASTDPRFLETLNFCKPQCIKKIGGVVGKAVKSRYPISTLEFLIKAGADPDCRQFVGGRHACPTDVAIDMGNADAVRCLVENGAKPLPFTTWADTRISRAMSSGTSTCIDVLKVLLLYNELDLLSADDAGMYLRDLVKRLSHRDYFIKIFSTLADAGVGVLDSITGVMAMQDVTILQRAISEGVDYSSRTDPQDPYSKPIDLMITNNQYRSADCIKLLISLGEVPLNSTVIKALSSGLVYGNSTRGVVPGGVNSCIESVLLPFSSGFRQLEEDLRIKMCIADEIRAPSAITDIICEYIQLHTPPIFEEIRLRAISKFRSSI